MIIICACFGKVLVIIFQIWQKYFQSVPNYRWYILRNQNQVWNEFQKPCSTLLHAKVKRISSQNSVSTNLQKSFVQNTFPTILVPIFPEIRCSRQGWQGQIKGC